MKEQIPKIPNLSLDALKEKTSTPKNSVAAEHFSLMG